MTRHFVCRIVAAALTMAPGPSFAQALTAPIEIETAALRPGVESMAIYLSRDGQLQRLGTLWDELLRLDSGGVSRLRRVYRTTNSLFGAHLDTIYSTWPTLRPISRKTDAERSRASIVFREDSVLGWTHTPPQSRRLIRVRSDPTLYDGSSFDLLVRAGSLREGAVLAVRGFVESSDTAVVLQARVEGSDRLAVEGGSTDTWIVEMDFAGLASTLWIDKRSRALVHQVIRLGPGMRSSWRELA